MGVVLEDSLRALSLVLGALLVVFLSAALAPARPVGPLALGYLAAAVRVEESVALLGAALLVLALALTLLATLSVTSVLLVAPLVATLTVMLLVLWPLLALGALAPVAGRPATVLARVFVLGAAGVGALPAALAGLGSLSGGAGTLLASARPRRPFALGESGFALTLLALSLPLVSTLPSLTLLSSLSLPLVSTLPSLTLLSSLWLPLVSTLPALTLLSSLSLPSLAALAAPAALLATVTAIGLPAGLPVVVAAVRGLFDAPPRPAAGAPLLAERVVAARGLRVAALWPLKGLLGALALGVLTTLVLAAIGRASVGADTAALVDVSLPTVFLALTAVSLLALLDALAPVP